MFKLGKNKNLLNIFFALLGYSFVLNNALYEANRLAHIQSPILFFFQKRNKLFSLIRFLFSLIKKLILSLNIFTFLERKTKIFTLVFYFLVLINFLKRKVKKNIFFKTFKIIKIFKTIKRIFSYVINAFLDDLFSLTDTTKFFTWFHYIFGVKRKWIKTDKALFFIPHFIIYNYTLSILVDIFSMAIYAVLRLIFARKILFLTKQTRGFIFVFIELIRILIYLVASFYVLLGRYPSKIPYFSISTKTTIGSSPDKKKKAFRMPDGRTLSYSDILDKTI